MRISDWSSDVCSSDLRLDLDRAGDVDLLAEGGIGSGDAVIDLLAHGHFELGEPLDLFPLHEAGHLEQLGAVPFDGFLRVGGRSEEHTSELQSLMRISYAVFCLKKKPIQQVLDQ